MNDTAEKSCAIIAAVGAAKGCFIEAMRYARDNQIEDANKVYEEGVQNYNVGHQVHHELVTQFANGVDVGCDILMVHAECQMMSAEDFMVLSKEMIDAAEGK